MGTCVLIRSDVIQGFTAEAGAVNVSSGPVLSQPGANIPLRMDVQGVRIGSPVPEVLYEHWIEMSGQHDLGWPQWHPEPR